MDRDEANVVSASGLEGVEVARTALSYVGGEEGRLLVAGHDVEQLARHSRYEDVWGLLWDGRAPDPAEREALQGALGMAREQAFDEIPRLGSALDRPDAMDALRAAVGHLSPPDGGREAALLVTAAVAVFAAAWVRTRAGQIRCPPTRGAAMPPTTSGWRAAVRTPHPSTPTW